MLFHTFNSSYGKKYPADGEKYLNDGQTHLTDIYNPGMVIFISSAILTAI